MGLLFNKLGNLNIYLFIYLFFSNFFFYHNKIHRVTNYIAIKNKIIKTRQHRTNKKKQNKMKKKKQ